MWTGEPFLYHSALSPALNLKLLHPRECVDAALDALNRGRAPMQSVEAFIRQIIGWREFIRGTYDREGPDYERRNYLDQHRPLPEFYWTARTDMNCLRECVGQVLEHGFSHHIQRLMVLANFSLLAGVHPKAISDWFLGMYVDGVDWVTLPNTLGMAMHADGTHAKGPVVGTKPYAAGGAYIKRMSNYCTSCKYDPAQRTGDDACPFTTMYWDFMHRHRARFAKNPRMAQLLANLDRFGPEQVHQITISARGVRERVGIER
jgi:deoxyribodipyrimidine photolyase-related protein